AFKHNLITEREKEIIRFCLDGLTVSEIAEKKKISIKTVYHHQLSACKKLGVTKLTRLLNIWQV
ncbi:helix-turn-helix domain-containing protein, partial [Enterobacter bugandensis]